MPEATTPATFVPLRASALAGTKISFEPVAPSAVGLPDDDVPEQAAAAPALPPTRPPAETPSTSAAARSVLEQVAREIPRASPGVPRELELGLETAELGRVRVRIEQLEGGLIRVELRASSTEAARVLQGGLAEFRQSLERLHMAVEVPPVAVGLGTSFSGRQGRQESRGRYFERERAAGAVTASIAGGGGGGRLGRIAERSGLGIVDVLA